jgi:hypothetical protein
MTGIKKISRLSLLVFACIAPGWVMSADLVINAIELLGYGVFESSSVEMGKQSNSERPRVDWVRGVQFTENSKIIPAVPGSSFGFSYRVNSTPRGSILNVVHVIIFPEGGLRTPRGKVYEESRDNVQIKLGEPTIYGYGFDEPWEAVTGEWTFQVWYKQSRLLQKTFTVIAPPEEEGAKERMQAED